MENNLVDKKLNLLQRLRVNIITKFPQKGKFFSYPEYIRNSEKVIAAYFEKGYGQELIDELKRENYGRLSQNFNQRNCIYENMTAQQKLEFYEESLCNEILPYVDKHTLFKDYALGEDAYKYLYLKTNDIDYLIHVRQGLTELLTAGQVPDEQMVLLYNRTQKALILPYLSEQNILNLAIDNKIKESDYLQLNEREDLLKAKLVYVNHNALFYLNIQNETVLNKLFEKIDLNEIMSSCEKDKKMKFLNSRNNILKYLDKPNLEEYVIFTIEGLKNNPEDIINLYDTLSNKGISSSILDYIRPTNRKWEFYLGAGRCIIERNFGNKDENEIRNIRTAFEKIMGEKTGEEGNDNRIEENADKKYFDILKVLNNPRLINRMSHEDIINYLETDMSYESICKIVEKAYGVEAVSILRERPGLGIIDIPTFDIFEPEIIDLIGYGGVHTYLTYFMDSKDVITEMVENPKMLEDYKKFREIVKNFYPPSAIGLEDTMQNFKKHYNLLSQAFEGEITEELSENILLMLRDEEFFEYEKYLGRAITEPKKIENVEQLTKYKEFRNKEYNNLIDNSEINNKRKLILAKYFGNISNCAGNYNSYDHKEFLEDYLTFNESEFSDYELDCIELYSIISDIIDNQVLDELNLYLEKNQVISPVDMKAIDTKVIESYKKEYLASILSIEEAERMIQGDGKSEKYIEKTDGRKIYKDRIVSKNETIYSRLAKNGKIVQMVQTDTSKKYRCDNLSYEVKIGENGEELAEGDSQILQLYEEGQKLENSMKVEDGDVEIYELYDVDKQISIHAIRGGITSDKLVFAHPELDTSIGSSGNYEITNLNEENLRIIMEKSLEHGISSRSLYYVFDTSNRITGLKIGYGYTNLDPNSIIGFSGGDAGTSHNLKSLKVHMTSGNNILRNASKAIPNASEVATLRYEYDLSNIKPGTKGGRNEMDFILSIEDMELAKKHAIAFSKPIIKVHNQKQLTNSKRPQVREKREKSELIQSVEKIAKGEDR